MLLLRLAALVLVASALSSSTAAVQRPIQDSASSTHQPWGPWGPCTQRCVQFRRRQCRSRIGRLFQWTLPLSSCRPLYQRQSCSADFCAAAQFATSSNLTAQTCGSRPSVQMPRGRTRAVMRIFGGDEAAPHSWPWHINLVQYRGSSNHFCGGTLIHPEFVLTAAHCVTKTNDDGHSSLRITQDLYAKVGDHSASRQRHERWLPVRKVLLHPSTNQRNIEFDFALLRLQEPARIGQHVQPACLPSPHHAMAELAPGTNCTAIGFGKFTKGEDATMSEFLREAKLQLLRTSECRRQYAFTNVEINRRIHVCASGKGSDTCSGDSGGGLFCRDPSSNRWYLHAVTSFGHPMGCGMHSGVYQRAAAVFDWVQRTVRHELNQ